ncbi:hypothetical protein GJ744_000288 [Endocarpon pusillum]|uniref:Uncharacterized protein n=1 Tax=Endocarpon pusillum TaxID=364733 RepID=A0A8H7ATI0_9EURO|nr:hypothetical protein GJ744_000288 [Endocarpon pusillum]
MNQHHPLNQAARGGQTSSELHIYEILDDEIGYDADVETVRPDAYEEPDSEKGEGAISSSENEERWQDELVKQMKTLDCNSNATTVSNEDGSSCGRKRRSKDAFGSSAAQVSTGLSESRLEITEIAEIADDQEARPRLKRMRRRSRRSKTIHGIISKSLGSQSEPGEHERCRTGSRALTEDSVATESSPQDPLDDAMELG